MNQVILFFAGLVVLANGQCPTITTRGQWGARPPTGSTHMGSPVQNVVIHHTAGATCSTSAGCAAEVRAIQNMHMNSNGWADIGYSFLIGGSDPVWIYEGRGWNKVGAHAPGYNSNSIGISFMGNYMTSLPSAVALSMGRKLITCGISLGKITSSRRILGHRDAVATACPGDRLYNEIKNW